MQPTSCHAPSGHAARILQAPRERADVWVRHTWIVVALLCETPQVQVRNVTTLSLVNGIEHRLKKNPEGQFSLR
jgi:hypothetical protein